jgi:hypothetical protein
VQEHSSALYGLRETLGQFEQRVDRRLEAVDRRLEAFERLVWTRDSKRSTTVSRESNTASARSTTRSRVTSPGWGIQVMILVAMVGALLAGG